MFTQGEAKAEKWGDPKTDPTYIIKIDKEIRFQTVGDEDEDNAKEFVKRWNSFKVLLTMCETAAETIRSFHKFDINTGYCPNARVDGECEVCNLYHSIEKFIRELRG